MQGPESSPSAALCTDLYELRMAQAMLEAGLTGPATFSLSCRRLPARRNLLVAAGLDDVLGHLEAWRLREDELRWLGEAQGFPDRFLAWLADLRFRGDVRAVPEGTPVFADEPILEIDAPLPEAQLVETLVLNRVHLHTVLASKAHRVVQAARGRPVVDFGLRRAHGLDAGFAAARALILAGGASTSHVGAGYALGVPVSGTMAHSWVQAHDDELEAFRAFCRVHPGTTLLVDTYDTVAGVERVVALAAELGPAFDVVAIRLDSGDLDALARASRSILDAAGLQRVRILASGGLDEDAVAALVDAGVPIDAFGVGTSMTTSSDAPALDAAYKLVAYDGVPRLKTSTGKATWPGPKQVWRIERDGEATHDVLGVADEDVDGRPLLAPVMTGGRRTDAGRATLAAARATRARELARLPERVRGIAPAAPPYRVEVTPALERARAAAVRRATGR